VPDQQLPQVISTPSSPATADWKKYPYQAGPFTFPQDEGFHPAALEEWWYINGHLRSEDGRLYDFMVCFYRHGIIAASLLDVDASIYYNRSMVFVDDQRAQGRLDIRYGPSELSQIDGEPFTYQLVYKGPDFSLNLRLESLQKPLVVNGDGVISMGHGVSYYYSLTDLATSGSLAVGTNERAVSGGSWMDRQWGDWNPSLDWDWYSIKLDNGLQVVAYRLFEDGGFGPVITLVSAIDQQGNAYHFNQSGDWYQIVLGYDHYWRSPSTGKLYSAGWTMAVPGLNLTLSISPAKAEQETLFPVNEQPASRGKPFWEGACSVSGRYDGQPVSGRAFVETTFNYDEVRGDLVVTPKEYIQDGDHSELVAMVQNLGGRSLDNVEVRLTLGSPFDGGKILVTYHLNDRHNSTSFHDSLPYLGDTPLYLIVDPDNRMAETDEGNNIAVAVLK
jgi:predicted secreted hydrolase